MMMRRADHSTSTPSFSTATPTPPASSGADNGAVPAAGMIANGIEIDSSRVTAMRRRTSRRQSARRCCCSSRTGTKTASRSRSAPPPPPFRPASPNCSCPIGGVSYEAPRNRPPAPPAHPRSRRAARPTAAAARRKPGPPSPSLGRNHANQRHGSRRLRRLTGRVSHEIVFRYRSGVAPVMRLRSGARLFEIAAVIDVDERRRWLKCLCVERDL